MGDGIRRDLPVVGPQLVGIVIPSTKGGEVGVGRKTKNVASEKMKGGEVELSG